MGMLCLDFQPLPFIIPNFAWKGTPFQIHFPLLLCQILRLWIQTIFLYQNWRISYPFLYQNWRISYPFFIPTIMNSLTFFIPWASKRYPFWVTHPHIAQYAREYPAPPGNLGLANNKRQVTKTLKISTEQGFIIFIIWHFSLLGSYLMAILSLQYTREDITSEEME